MIKYSVREREVHVQRITLGKAPVQRWSDVFLVGFPLNSEFLWFSALLQRVWIPTLQIYSSKKLQWTWPKDQTHLNRVTALSLWVKRNYFSDLPPGNLVLWNTAAAETNTDSHRAQRLTTNPGCSMLSNTGQQGKKQSLTPDCWPSQLSQSPNPFFKRH
jgi:hypothetical protein